MYVYGEEVFLINFIMDFTMSVFVMKISGIKINICRAAFSAAAGGIYAVISLYIKTNIFHSMAVCIIMAWIISGNELKRMLHSAVMLFLFLLLSGGGTVFIINYFSGMKGNIFMMLAGSIISATIFLIVRKNIICDGKIISGIHNSTLTHSGKEYSLRLFNDTGNLLTTPSGEGIIVLGENIFTDIFGDMIDTDTFRGGILFVNAKTITGEKVFFVIKAEKMYIPSEGCVISPAYITSADIDTARFDGIININLTGGKYVQKNNS